MFHKTPITACLITYITKNSIILQNKYLSNITTILTKNILISNPKRTMMSGSSGGGKKFGEEIAKKCIGAACGNTKPFTPDNNTDVPKVKVPVHNNTFTKPASTSQNQNQTQTSYSTNNKSKMKEISKPIESIADKVIMNKANPNLTFNNAPKDSSEKTTTNITDNPNYSTLKPSANMSSEDIAEISKDFSLAVDDFINIPTAPPLPLLPLTKTIPQSTSNDPTFQQQILTSYKEREARASEINFKLQQLQECGLLKYQDNQEKLTHKFHELPKKTVENFVKIDIDFLQNNSNIVFDVGMLEVINVDETVLLSGLHTHVTVIYTVKDNQKIVMGYLTSDKSKTSSIKLSDYQPFNDGNNNNKKQYFAPLQKPLVILEDKYFKHLPYSEISQGIMQNQQEIGQVYINKKEIYDILQEQFKSKIIPEIQKQKGLLEIYDGKGITMEIIDYALIQQKIKDDKQLEYYFKEYIQYKNQQKEKALINFFNHMQKTEPKIYEKLIKLIEQHENKFK